jgi:hypothetical protein
MPAAPAAITERLIVCTGSRDPVATSVRTSAATLTSTEATARPRTTGELHPLMRPIVRAGTPGWQGGNPASGRPDTPP